MESFSSLPIPYKIRVFALLSDVREIFPSIPNPTGTNNRPDKSDIKGQLPNIEWDPTCIAKHRFSSLLASVIIFSTRISVRFSASRGLSVYLFDKGSKSNETRKKDFVFAGLRGILVN